MERKAGISVIIKGKDYSNVIFDLRESRSDANEGVWLEIERDPALAVYTDSNKLLGKKELLARLICKGFLSEVEKSKDSYTILFDKRSDGRTLPETVIVDTNEWRYKNVVGVLQRSNCAGEDLLSQSSDAINLSTTIVNESGDLEAIVWDEEGIFEKWARNQKYDINLQIESRFDDENTYFLPTLLMYGNSYDDYEMPAPAGDDDMFDYLMLFMFRNQLKEAYTGGLYKAYTYFRRNDAKLKGVIDFSRHIKQNIGLNNGKIAYTSREYSPDNSMNHLILHTFNYAEKRFPALTQRLKATDSDFSRIITQLRFLAPSYEYFDVKTTINKCRKPISHPLHFKYEILRITCLKLLRNMGLSLFDDTYDDTQGILFYIPDLWEKYLENSIVRAGINVKAQEKVPVYINEQAEEGHPTYPDYILIKHDEPIMVMDAKYKDMWGAAYADGNGKLPSRGLDDYTKCIRDMVSQRVFATGTIFPVRENDLKNELIKEDNRYDSKHIKHNPTYRNIGANFYSIPVIVPSSEGLKYDEWSKQFEEKVNKAVNDIQEKLKDENSRLESLKRIRDYLERHYDQLINENLEKDFDNFIEIIFGEKKMMIRAD